MRLFGITKEGDRIGSPVLVVRPGTSDRAIPDPNTTQPPMTTRVQGIEEIGDFGCLEYEPGFRDRDAGG